MVQEGEDAFAMESETQSSSPWEELKIPREICVDLEDANESSFAAL